MSESFELGPQRGVFRGSTGVLWPFSAAIAALLLPLALTRIARLDPWSWPAAAAALASLLLTPILVFGLMAPLFWIFRIRVHELGLRGFDAYGRFRSVRWPLMTEVSRVDLLTLPYLRIRTSEAGVELMLPFFLADRAGFERLVSACAGPAHPLTRYFGSAGRRDD